MAELHKICTLLDKLTIDTLILMQEYVQKKLDLESTLKEGEINLAKSRYILGQNNVSNLQLPSEDSPEFNAVAVLHSEHDEELGYRTYDLEFLKPTEAKEGDSKVSDPLKWFGVLVPQNLHKAQSKFKQGLLGVVQVADVQARLSYNCDKLGQLRELKNKLLEKEE